MTEDIEEGVIVESTEIVEGGQEAETEIEEVDHVKKRCYSPVRFIKVV